MAPDRVFVVRSGPSLERLKRQPPVEALKQGRKYLVGYVGVMGKQEGIDYLLRAAAHLVHGLKRTDVQFGLVGGGTSLVGSLMQLARLASGSNEATATQRLRLLAFISLCAPEVQCLWNLGPAG